MWLLELGSDRTRILFDPLLTDVHDAGLSTLVPTREVMRERLAPDFIIVSHRHPDHFDVDSLAWLAAADPQTVVLTSDPMVAQVCGKLGFRSVSVLGAWDRVELEGGALLTTPSYGSSVEWGVAAMSVDGLVWNHIDSVLGSPEQIQRSLEVLRGASGQAVHLHLARWCPVLEVAPQLGGRLGFPRGSYGQLLDGLALLGREEPTALAPAAVSVVPRAPFDGLGRNTFPVTLRRFRRDLEALAPEIQQLDVGVGDVVCVHQGSVTLEERASPLAKAVEASALPLFVPFEVVELTDPQPSVQACERREEPLREIREWLENRLVPRLRELSCGAPPWQLPLVLCLDLRSCEPCGSDDGDCSTPGSLDSGVQGWTLTLGAAGCGIRAGLDADYDQLVAVTLSGLTGVLSGRSSWGELLLSGQLRCSDRAFRVCEGELRRVAWLPALFVYACPGYEESFEAATWGRVAELLDAGSRMS